MNADRTSSLNWAFLFREHWKGEENRAFQMHRFVNNRQIAQREYERFCNMDVPMSCIFGQILAAKPALIYGAYLPRPKWANAKNAVYHFVRPNYDTGKIPVPKTMEGSWDEAVHAFETEFCPSPSQIFLLVEHATHTDEAGTRPYVKRTPAPQYTKDQMRLMEIQANRAQFQEAMANARSEAASHSRF